MPFWKGMNEVLIEYVFLIWHSHIKDPMTQPHGSSKAFLG